MFYYYDSSYFFYAIITTAIMFYAHLKVKTTFNKYANIKCRKNITGLFSAESVLMQNEVDNVVISQIPGKYNDYYDPKTNKICLSEFVYYDNSITSASVAAHEAGHAVQYSRNYTFGKIRQGFVPIVQICSNLSTPLVFLGLFLPWNFNFIVDLGIILFSTSVIFHLITLPVELDASRRALSALECSGYFDGEELLAAKRVLNAAAFTYVASLSSSFMYLFRLIAISNSRKKND
ncbi:MAG: zinc metallopeptidase [Candidatus Improbicoccus pseudotrichonymphae]|uniref:Zinc metallopeptidase n=1 Tax=Candidatus Improbicoccus pseudotrichonymphae TaxID=3033792 RepID=A0AA48HXV6_9FIRM|nr:MAG: zinc metallopeptidase [Candidatus Improbicoccus pseudotrichonymphae]